MSNSNSDSGTDESAPERDTDADRVSVITVSDQTVLFDVDNPEGWIQTDTTVDLVDVA